MPKSAASPEQCDPVPIRPGVSCRETETDQTRVGQRRLRRVLESVQEPLDTFLAVFLDIRVDGPDVLRLETVGWAAGRS